MPAYRHRPLKRTCNEEQEFRLLRLFSGRNSVLECELYHSTIPREEGVYEALSYTWGSGDLVETIIMDQKQLWVTDSVHTALLFLRHPDQDRIIWVDSICINQKDEVEKSQQVQQMARIYKCANTVLIWLGKATAEISLLFSLLNSIFVDAGKKFPHPIWRLESNQWKGLWQSATPVTSTSFCWQGLITIYQRPWFERIWILQEVANARKAVVCCGTSSIPAQLLIVASTVLDVLPQSHCRSVLDVIPGPLRDISWWNQKRDLLNLMQKFDRAKASDERDKIFALLGLLDMEHAETIEADYTLKLPDVVHRIIHYLFENSHAIATDILDLLARFQSLRTVFLVPLSGKHKLLYKDTFTHIGARRAALETILQDSDLNKDKTLFYLEQTHRDGSEDTEGRFHQVIQMLHASDPQRNNNDQMVAEGDDVISWRDQHQNVKLMTVHHPRTILVDAAHDGSRQIIRILMSQRHRLGLTDAALFWVLSDAMQSNSKNGARKAVELLIDEGVYGCDKYISTRLHSIIHCEASEPLLNLYLSRNSKHIEPKELDRLLITACSSGYLSIATLLLDHGANANAQVEVDKVLTSVLEAAVDAQNARIVECLLGFGASPNTMSEAGSALLKALMKFPDDITTIIPPGLDSSKEYIRAFEILGLLLQHSPNPNNKIPIYGTALFATIHARHLPQARFLIKLGARVKTLDPHNWSIATLTRVMELDANDVDESCRELDGHEVASRRLGPTCLRDMEALIRKTGPNSDYYLQGDYQTTAIADHPLPVGVAVAYFEVRIEYFGERYNFRIGLDPAWSKDVENVRSHCVFRYRKFDEALRDWKHCSRESCHTMNLPFSPESDGSHVFGCGLHYANNLLFYTMDGKPFDFGESIPPFQLFPVIESMFTGKINVNFGQEPFLYKLPGGKEGTFARIKGQLQKGYLRK